MRKIMWGVLGVAVAAGLAVGYYCYTMEFETPDYLEEDWWKDS